ncbi:ApeA N-terminal domain 1-containing protein [Kitasatospora purpeofusca]|uniref:ApeA N-terminal domain 1-containing protein n=1 Tax=Kitasatospora purpeofusca TaxID=67352 RepID=UPI00380E8A03
MKKLPVEPGTYACTFDIDGVSVSGEISLESGQRPRGTAFEMPADWTASDGGTVRHADFPQSRRFDVLRGRLRSGHHLVLAGVSVRNHFNTATIWADMALCGFGLPADGEPYFDTVEFQVGGLTELSGTWPLEKIQLPTPATNEHVASVSWHPDVKQQWQTDDGDSIALDYTSTMRFEPGFAFHVTTQPTVTASGTPRPASEWIEAYVGPIADITAFATARQQPTCWVQLTSKTTKPHYAAQVFSAEIIQEPYTSRAPEPHAVAPVVRLGPEGASLATLLHRWRSMQQDYGTFFAYMATATLSMPYKQRFLALVPALESYHTAKYGDGPQTRKEFTKTRRAVLRRLVDAEVPPDDVEWLNTWVNRIGSHPLNVRLRQLLADLPDALRQRLTAATDPLPESLGGWRSDLGDIWEIMGKARNDLAHGGEHPPAQAVRALTFLAHTMAVGLALQQLEVPDTELVRLIDDGSWAVL